MLKFHFKMKYQSYIEELQNPLTPLELHHIHCWLIKYESEFYNSIDESSCRKWNNCHHRNEKPFPCVCPTREDSCVFVELYYELDKIAEQEYSNNTDFIESDLLELVIITQNEPYQKINFLIQISKVE